MSRSESFISIESAPHRLDDAYSNLFSAECLKFIQDLVTEFDKDVDRILLERVRRNVAVKSGEWKPQFRNRSQCMDWKIGTLPERLRNRKLDLGDVSPANTPNFVDALYADVQGIQVDFDDGHCPTWRNTVLGLSNVTAAVHSTLVGGPDNISEAPILMLRPRAFNMIEHHCMVNGKEVSGPLFDFATLMFHNAKKMHELKIGPYFYLSKIEDSIETELWNRIFVWSQHKLQIPHGSIKACVLIENILASYCMEDILFSIKDHAIGLNCGIWDYSASIIQKFGDNREYLIPDRNKYVNMSQPFLRKYMKLVINTCHRRSAIATGGMAAKILPPGDGTSKISLEIINDIKKSKMAEILDGIDGFMVYDLRVIEPIQEMWVDHCQGDNQMHIMPRIDRVAPIDLLQIPKGGVTIEGLNHNIEIALLFIYHWLSGSGIFFYNGAVEDSATAEISRSQLWQWIRHSAAIEDHPTIKRVNRSLVYQLLDDCMLQMYKTWCYKISDKKRLLSSKFILLDIISSRNYIEYITTFLNDSHKFRTLHNKNDRLQSKL